MWEQDEQPASLVAIGQMNDAMYNLYRGCLAQYIYEWWGRELYEVYRRRAMAAQAGRIGGANDGASKYPEYA